MATVSFKLVYVLILIPFVVKWYQYSNAGPNMPINLRAMFIWQFYSVYGYKIPITDDMVLITSMPFESVGNIYKIDFNFEGRLRFEAILFWKLLNYYLLGNDL